MSLSIEDCKKKIKELKSEFTIYQDKYHSDTMKYYSMMRKVCKHPEVKKFFRFSAGKAYEITQCNMCNNVFSRTKLQWYAGSEGADIRAENTPVGKLYPYDFDED